MKLWLVCFFILFFGAEAAQWLGQFPWLGRVELSLPLTLVGGLGLALASNHRAIFGEGLVDDDGPRLGAVSPKSTASPPPEVAPLDVTEKSIPVHRQAGSISFEIKKPSGKR